MFFVTATSTTAVSLSAPYLKLTGKNANATNSASLSAISAINGDASQCLFTFVVTSFASSSSNNDIIGVYPATNSN
jgi:hypothetical protein